MAVSAGCHADPHAALAGQCQPGGHRRRGLSRQPLPRGPRIRCCSARAQPAYAIRPGDEVPHGGRRERLVHRLGGGPAPFRTPEYRYYWDNWGVKAHTIEGGYSRYFGDAWLAEGLLRFNHQSAALFYSDNAENESLYISRNRQLGAYNNYSLGGRVSYAYAKVPGRYEIKLHGSLEVVRFDYQNFTDLRTGKAYGFTGGLLQLYLTANF